MQSVKMDSFSGNNNYSFAKLDKEMRCGRKASGTRRKSKSFFHYEGYFDKYLLETEEEDFDTVKKELSRIYRGIIC